MQQQMQMTDEAAHALAATRERLSGYHDPGSIEPEQSPTIESRYGFELVIDGSRHDKATFEEFAIGVVNAYATVDADVAVRIKTGPSTSRELTPSERARLLEAATALVLS